MATTTVTATTLDSFSDQSRATPSNVKGPSLTGNFKWEDVLVPATAGRGAVKWQFQRRALAIYVCAAAIGLSAFYLSENPSLRAAGVGLLFPGAGLIAVCSITSILAFVISTALIPLTLFAWFGAGGILFPILQWTGTTALAAWLAGDSLLEVAAPLWITVCAAGIAWIVQKTRSSNEEAQAKRVKRNEYLINSVMQSQASARKPAPGTRELDERTLRFMQWSIELGLRPKDDFSYHDIIDQFQTSAIRYQLYEAVSDLGMYQYIYTPNFHGYLSEASRGAIEKSLTERVIGFWKYESSWGKFKVRDWDPVKEDNIMVSGYLLTAVGIYQSNTGDERYSKPGSLKMEVSPRHVYPYDFGSIAEAVNDNWVRNPYCLFPCEPNWIYTPCNLVGITGIKLSDRMLGRSHGDDLKKRFETSLEEEFSQQDGSILPIRSELTGFTIPGLAGRLSDGVNAILCAAYLPHIAHRNWAFTKNEAMKWTKDGKLEFVDLVGADNLDPGNYKPGIGYMHPVFAAAAAEFGDLKIRDQLLKQLDEEHHPVFTTKTGALKNKGLSTLGQGTALRARLGAYQDWVDMITKGPPENVLKGPILDSVPFPDVLVAKAYSQDGESIDLVFLPGKKPGIFDLGFKRLVPGREYLLAGKSEVADKDGKAGFSVEIDGRTALKLTPV